MISAPATDLLSGVDQIALSNDGTEWTPRPYAVDQAWNLASGDGLRTVYVRWHDGAGNWSNPQSDSIILATVVVNPTAPVDSTAPLATAPTKTLVAGSSLTSGKPTVRFAWSGSDAGACIRH